MTTEAAMTTDPKIYTAAEVASVGISEEKVDYALATVTREAYKAAERGGRRVIHHNDNLNILNEIDRRLRELGYTTKIFERAIDGPYVIVRWDTD
ncbi:hypothetical protein M3668_06635 [Rothia sp. P100]|uniref:hypothetical protein n=1 Tax=Rothia sp. P100 TaxID=2939578 RepID=UPI00203F5C9F|nr:hypothetical protein [Rothia sp. P100]MCM3510451.1 hypothetical protein [Rothia sp. P100]